MNRFKTSCITVFSLFFFSFVTLFSLNGTAFAAKTKTKTSSSKKSTLNKKRIIRKTTKTSIVQRSVVTRSKHSPTRLKKSSIRKTSVATTKVATSRVTTKKKSRSATAVAIPGDIGKKISARSAIIIDAKSGRTLYAKAPDNPRQPASTIKILTGMIALKALSGGEKVQISQWAAGQPSSKVNLDTKKQYQANDLINAVLLASANDASVALAEKIAGSESSFAKMMTEKARQWGAQNTVCKTATGLTAKGQASTARDLAMMFRHVMADPIFSSRMKQVKVKTSFGALLRNHNKALWQVEGTQGGKTGFTNAARQTYVGKFKRGETEIVVAVMGCETMWTDVKNLVQHGFALENRGSTASKNSAIEVHGLVAGTSL
jgi:D-alanyl-D-alanine carboxypeptidase (penicillin-binding protein 5/6)